jgi:branched-chain amino acid transport system permease protein
VMDTFFGIPFPTLYSQLMIGLINGSFYALLSLGLAVIFGMLHVVNFTHGAQYMLGAFIAWLLLEKLGINYWLGMLIAPFLVAVLGALIERNLLSRLRGKDPIYGLLLTFGLAMALEGSFQYVYGSSGRTYAMPDALTGGLNLGFMYLPVYRGWVIAASLLICGATWLVIEKTKIGMHLRASTEKPVLVQAFGINVPLLVTMTYAVGAGLAALAGVLAAPVYQVGALMGQNIIIVVFAIVVIGGMGSIFGAVATAYMLGLVEALTKIFYPQGASIAVFVVMAVVLLVRPAGLFGKE